MIFDPSSPFPGEIALAPILLAENPYAAYLSAVEAIAASATSTS
jgi:hypothetical protein